MMRFVIFGLTVSSSWGNGHATIWRGLCNSLSRQGHSVTFFEKDAPYYRSHRDLVHPSFYKLELYDDWSNVEQRARAAVAQCDCAVVSSYCPDARPASDVILDAKAFAVFYDLDTPVTLDELSRTGEVSYIPAYGLEPFDLVLSYTGGKALPELSRRLGARRVAPLYGSVDPNIHRRVPQDPTFRSDFSYLGTYAADRQSQLEELFLRPARRTPEKKFCIAGALYPADFPWTSNTYFVRHLSPPQHPAFYSSSRMTLNITRATMAQMGYCPSGRLFEAAACGTPIVSDWWEGLDEFFKPGEEIVIARNSEDVLDAIRLDDCELKRLSRRSLLRALTQHTAAHRATELISLIEASA
jgi:spore maturation protein CgeB